MIFDCVQTGGASLSDEDVRPVREGLLLKLHIFMSRRMTVSALGSTYAKYLLLCAHCSVHANKFNRVLTADVTEHTLTILLPYIFAQCSLTVCKLSKS
jgi:hypothetical protein